ncbi:hypothetical protein NB693_23455 [Pantoea ananatis]|nr:hypothetical protein [Pantoea ananatis]
MPLAISLAAGRGAGRRRRSRPGARTEALQLGLHQRRDDGAGAQQTHARSPEGRPLRRNGSAIRNGGHALDFLNGVPAPATGATSVRNRIERVGARPAPRCGRCCARWSATGAGRQGGLAAWTLRLFTILFDGRGLPVRRQRRGDDRVPLRPQVASAYINELIGYEVMFLLGLVAAGGIGYFLRPTAGKRCSSSRRRFRSAR